MDLYLHVPNIFTSHLEMVRNQWNVMGGYIALNNVLTIDDILKAIIRRTHGAELMVDGDFNTNLEDPERRRPLPEHSHTIYFNKYHYVPVSGIYVEPWGKGIKSVLVVVVLGYGGDTDIGLGRFIGVGGEGGIGGGVIDI